MRCDKDKLDYKKVIWLAIQLRFLQKPFNDLHAWKGISQEKTTPNTMWYLDAMSRLLLDMFTNTFSPSMMII
jgi:hypothetical protein